MGTTPATAPGPLRFALLGLLTRRALTGWEILQRFQRSIVFFWNARRSQIYAELGRLERAGLVRSRIESQRTRPDRRCYAITPAGRAALRAWLDAPTPVQPIKDEMLLRTFFADQIPGARAAEHLRRHGDEHERVLAEFEAIRARLEARHGPLDSTPDRALFFGALVLEQGIRFERAYAGWCRWAAAEVERRGGEHLPAPDASRAPDFIMTT